MAINKAINKSTKTHAAMRNCIEYVLKPHKIQDGLVYVTGPYVPDSIDYDNVYRAFMDEKQIWDKDSGRMYNHNIISFHRDEVITADAAFDFGKEFAEKWFPEHQTLVSVHQDREHIHIHLVTNTVSFVDGHKLHNTRNDLERMKEFTNRMCQDRALSIAEKGKHFDGTRLEEGEIIAWSKDKYHLVKNEEKNSFVADCAIAILDIVDHCTSREAFITGMKEKGWDVIWTDSKKHITFCDSEGHKVRDTNLSKSFTLEITKEALNGKFERQNELRTYRTESGAENRADPSKTGTVRHGSRQQPPSENRKKHKGTFSLSEQLAAAKQRAASEHGRAAEITYN